MRSVFIDTWGWVTLFNRKERHHQEVNQLYQHLRHTESTIVTTDYILDEVYTLLFRRVPFEFAQHALNTLSDAIEQGYITVIWMTPERFETAQNLRQQFHDKPNISFTESDLDGNYARTRHCRDYHW